MMVEGGGDEFGLFNWWGIEKRIKLIGPCIQKIPGWLNDFSHFSSLKKSDV